jgi:predicted nucleic acid-binding protein
MSRGRDLLLLDACVLINLFACGHVEEVLDALDTAAAIVRHVHREALFVRRGGTGDDAREPVQIDLARVLEQGLLQVVPDADEDELSTFIDLTLDLGDGEAMTAALAIHRGHAIATDDRVALRVIGSRVPVRSSLDLIKQWAEQTHVSSATISQALSDLRTRGRYLPGPQHPLRAWWDRYSERGGVDER